MSEETQAAPSTASETPAVPVVMEVDRGPLVNMTGDQRAEFRRTGTMPDMPKSEEAATSTEGEASGSETTPAGEAKTEHKPSQENRRKPTAEERIRQLTADNKRLKEEALKGKSDAVENNGGTTEKPVTEQPKVETPKVEPQSAPATRTKPTVEDKDKDGNPKYATYEDFVEDLADWKSEQRDAVRAAEAQQKAQKQEMDAKISEAKQRYGAEKFDEVLKPTVNTLLGDKDIPVGVKLMLNDSEVIADLLYTIGSDPQELADFVKMAKATPGKALRYIALTESLIAEELGGEAKPAAAAAAGSEGKTEIPPAKPQSQAPKPPAHVGGRAATPGDVLEAAATAGDFRAFKAEGNRRALARLKSS